MKKTFKVLLSLLLILTLTFSMPTVLQASEKPPKTEIKSVSAIVNGFNIKWNTKKVSGYQIQCATNKSFDKNKKTINVDKGSSSSKKVTKLKGNKKYYVRIRTYKTSNKKKTYSSWSKVKTVTTKAKKKPANSRVVYITPTGSKYHYSADCAGPNAIKKDISEVKGSYDPCKKCAG